MVPVSETLYVFLRRFGRCQLGSSVWALIMEYAGQAKYRGMHLLGDCGTA
jgi:hypothetical protein